MSYLNGYSTMRRRVTQTADVVSAMTAVICQGMPEKSVIQVAVMQYPNAEHTLSAIMTFSCLSKSSILAGGFRGRSWSGASNSKSSLIVPI